MLRAELKVLGGRQAGKTISIEKQFLVGREQDCHLRPKSDLVSRHHCVFTLDDYTLRVRDLGSTNGTTVNDERLEGQMVLKTGDRVRIGNLEFEVVLTDQEAAAASPSEEFQADDDSRIMTPEEAEHSPDETLVDMKVTPSGEEQADAPTEQFIGENTGDTGTIPTFDPNQQQWPQMPQQGYYPQYPPGYYPPQGMPYPPQGYPYYPQQPMPYPQQPQPQTPHESSESKPADEIPKVRLPDPSETGAHNEDATTQASSQGGGTQSTDGEDPTPSNTAAELLNKMRNRR
jgi:pSer/pThr/pTyr-binding forkhead associated (FHA) protein